MSKRRRSAAPAKSSSPSAATPAAPSTAEVRTAWQVHGLRIWLVVMIGATLQLTWPLWSERSTPPWLPLAPWPAFAHFGTMLAATAAATIFWPRAGFAAHVLVGLAAMTADQTRMQPQMFSFWLLMLGTLPFPVPQFLARCHLASLWVFSGFHKLLSPGYFDDVAPFLWQGIFPPASWPNMPDYSATVAATMACVEIALGIAICFPRCRRAAAVVVVLLHCGVVWLLQRHGNWNTSVWPWNLALAVVGATLVVTWKSTIPQERQKCGLPGFVAGVLLFFSPLLYYVGLLDAYLSHCLYSANVPTAVMIPSSAGQTTYRMNGIEGPYWTNVNAPQPPAHRIFEQYFREVARPGDRMIVEDPRIWAIWTGWDHYLWQHTGTTYERVRLPTQSRKR